LEIAVAKGSVGLPRLERLKMAKKKKLATWVLEVTEPLPPYKWIAQWAILLLGFAVALLAVILRANRSLHENGLPISVTLILVALLDLIPECARRLCETKDQRKFEHFFGKKCFDPEEGFHLVSAEREVAIENLHLLYAKGAPDDIRDDENKVLKAVPEGVRSWLAEQDIRACSYLAKLFALNKVVFRIGTDSDVNKKDVEPKSIIALGLGFNGWTNRLAKRFKGRLFGVFWGKSESNSDLGKKKTDQLIVGGTRIELRADEIGHYDYALIARIVADPGSGYVQFVCAGRTANGTAVAGHFLATRWPELAALYDGYDKGNYDEMDSHSLAVVIRHETGERDEMFKDGSGTICKGPPYNFVRLKV